MYDYGFSVAKKAQIPVDNMDMMVNVAGGKSDIAYVRQANPADITIYGNYDDKVEKIVNLPYFVYAPVKKGDVVGRADYLINGEVVQSIPILADEDIDEVYHEKNKSVVDIFLDFIGRFKK